MAEERKTLISPKGRCAFVQLLTPRAFEESEPKFSVVMLFDKEAQASPEFKRMVKAYSEERDRLYPNGAPANFKSPFRNSSEKESLPPDCIFVSLTTTRKPETVDADGQELFESSKLYSGIYGRASMSIYGYDKKGNKGIAFGLNNFQKLDDGEKMVGTTAAQDFGFVNKDDANVDIDAILNA
jgi:hypothetical protein